MEIGSGNASGGGIGKGGFVRPEGCDVGDYLVASQRTACNINHYV